MNQITDTYLIDFLSKIYNTIRFKAQASLIDTVSPNRLNVMKFYEN